MDPQSRLERLEARLAALEAELTALTAVVRREQEVRREAQRPADRPVAEDRAGLAAAEPPEPARGLLAKARRKTLVRDLETWYGENALLVVGLLALVAAAGFALKYAFDQGWISPALRVIAGLLGGIGLAAYGERMRRKGLGRYGGALVGGGSAIAYLAVWAAAGPYELVAAPVGIGALALLAVLVTASAARSGEQYLAALACAGAFGAPVILAQAPGSANLLVMYSGFVAVGAGVVSARFGWRTTFGIALAGFFLVPGALALVAADGALVSTYLALGGAAGVAVTQRRGWKGLRAAAFLLAWFLLAVHADGSGGWRAWSFVLMPAALVAPSYLAGMWALSGAPPGEPMDRLPGTRVDSEWLYFLAAAGAWAGVALLAGPPPISGYPLVLLGGVAAPYVAVGLRRQAPIFQATGVAILAWGVAEQADGLWITAGWALLALLSAAASRPERMARARWAGLGVAGLAAYRLMALDLFDRPATEAAFIGEWSLVFYLLVGTFIALAGPLWGRPADAGSPGGGIELRSVMWFGAGALFFAGGTSEIGFFFDRPDAAGQELVRGLAISVFWLLYAGALIGYGLWRELRAVRVAGLVVSALAILKVTFFDLSTLEALYRVASFGLLALIALAAAYAYHRRSRVEDESQSAAPSAR
ncbi:MAG: DUF2339 domain-containing protein [Gemmatimonadota bacterium]